MIPPLEAIVADLEGRGFRRSAVAMADPLTIKAFDQAAEVLTEGSPELKAAIIRLFAAAVQDFAEIAEADSE